MICLQFMVLPMYIRSSYSVATSYIYKYNVNVVQLQAYVP